MPASKISSTVPVVSPSENPVDSASESSSRVWKNFRKLFQRAPARVNAPDYSGPFTIDDTMRQAMVQDVQQLIRLGRTGEPSSEQWAMIFNEHPATRVMAAAGSGKSTTLLLRVIFMLKHLQIPAEALSVFSFTAASCQELRQKLITWARDLQLPHSTASLENCITTFHGRLLQQQRDESGQASQSFEMLGKNRRTQRQFSEYVPWGTSGLNHEQFRLLNMAYVDVYQHHTDFREELHELVELLLDHHHWQGAVHEENQQTLKIKLASQRDPALRQKIRLTLQAHGLWPERLQEPEGAGFQAGGYFIGASGQLADGRLVFFDELLLHPPFIEPNDQTQYLPTLAGIEARIQLISRCCFKPFLYISSRQQLLLLTHQLNIPDFSIPSGRQRPLGLDLIHLPGSPTVPLEAPGFSFRLNGDRSSLSIVEQWYNLATWMQCLGLDPLHPFSDRNLPEVEQKVLKLLPAFWQCFLKVLGERNISTFHLGFAAARKPSPDTEPSSWSKHLLIDEFQDIAPEIVYWLQAMQIRHAGQCSIMAIGDDWQSIYAWRGSSPQFLLNFAQYFSSSHMEENCCTLTLNENFRSINAIVQDAAKALLNVKQCSSRQIVSNVCATAADHGLAHWNLAPHAQRGRFHETVVQIIDFELSLLKSLVEPKILVLVLARKRDDLDKIDALLPLAIRPRIALHTLHNGKGLQAPVAIIIDDCTWDTAFPLRDALYRRAGMTISYQQTVQDEAHRLAYVGMTRAMRRLLWMTRESSPAKNGIVQYFQAWGITERTFPILGNANSKDELPYHAHYRPETPYE